MCKITIFTPTYNRAYILNRVYESLKEQTNKNFIWLIVDDGSTDNTKELVDKWIKESEIKIKYIKQDNSGKHIAHNTAVKNCDTDFLLILDSDDYLSKESIEVLNVLTDKISGMKDISGIIGNRYDTKTNQIMGTEMPKNIQYVKAIELYEKYSFKGETLRLYKTKILKENLFPKIDGEKFIYENVVFDKIDSKYKMLIDRHKLYYGQYLEDGYTLNSDLIKKQNPIGYAYALNSGIKYAITLKKKVKWTILYIVWTNENKIKNRFKEFSKKIFYIVLYPAAICFKIFRRKK